MQIDVVKWVPEHDAMIPILPILDPLARLAAAAVEHVNIRKANLALKEKEAQALARRQFLNRS